MEKALEWGERIPIGIIYQQERPTFEDGLTVLRKGPLVKQNIDPAQVSALLDEFV
jgi:2-oxoglutarate ferredoxin oxidoreductase subunit beta